MKRELQELIHRRRNWRARVREPRRGWVGGISSHPRSLESSLDLHSTSSPSSCFQPRTCTHMKMMRKAHSALYVTMVSVHVRLYGLQKRALHEETRA